MQSNTDEAAIVAAVDPYLDQICKSNPGITKTSVIEDVQRLMQLHPRLIPQLIIACLYSQSPEICKISELKSKTGLNVTFTGTEPKIQSHRLCKPNKRWFFMPVEMNPDQIRVYDISEGCDLTCGWERVHSPTSFIGCLTAASLMKFLRGYIESRFAGDMDLAGFHDWSNGCELKIDGTTVSWNSLPRDCSVRRMFEIRRDLLTKHKDEIGRPNTLPVQVPVQVEQNNSRQLVATRPTRATSIGDVRNARMEGSKVDNAPGAAGLPQPGVDKYVIPSESFLDGKHVIVFGAFSGYDIVEVETMVKSFGGILMMNYSKRKTNFLLAEDDNRRKINDFKKKEGVEHITLAAALARLKKNTSVEEADHARQEQAAAADDTFACNAPDAAYELRRATDPIQLPAQVGEQPRPNPSCITPAFEHETKAALDQLNACVLDQAKRFAAFEVKTAEANFQEDTQIAALKVKLHENTVETREMINKSNVAISQSNVAISELKVGQERFKLDLAETDATANRAERKADKVNERVVLEDAEKMTKSTAKRFPPKPVNSDEDVDSDPFAHLTGNASLAPTHYGQAAAAAVDESGDSFDEVEVNNNNIITPHSTSSKTKVAFACANEYFPIPARDSAKKPPADAKKKDENESSPPVTRTSTSSAKKSTPLRRSARRSARRSEV